MPSLRALALVVVVAAFMPLASAALAYDVVAFDADDNEYWFEVGGIEGRNPTLTFPPGEAVVINLTNRGSVEHNFHVSKPVSAMTGLIEPGESAVLEFVAPANATGEGAYWCDPHRHLGMGGIASFEPLALPPTPAPATTPAPPTDATHSTQPGSDDALPTPGPSFLSLLFAVALVALVLAANRRRM